MDYQEIMKWVLPSALVVGGLLFGILFKWLVLKRIMRLVAGTDWKWDDVVFDSLRNAPVLWFLCAGVYFAIYSVPIDQDIRGIAEKVLVTVVLLSVTLIFARLVGGITDLLAESSKVAIASASLISNVVRIFIIAIGVFIILQNLGISITPLIGALGIGGLAAALALQDTLSNLFAGFQIVISRQVRPGDHIKLDSGEIGYVTDVKWRNTTIKDFTDNMIIVPNNKLASAIVTNYNLPERNLWSEILVGISYDSDLEQVERVAGEVARESFKEVIGEELQVPPKFHYLRFGDSSIDFRVRIQVKDFGDRMPVQHDFIKRLHKRFNAEGIEIPFPIRTLYMKGEDK